MWFTPAEAAAGIGTGLLPARADLPQSGTIGQASFIAIPANTQALEGAQVTTNFLLSPVAQVRVEVIRGMDNLAVPDLARLHPEGRVMFDALPGRPEMLAPAGRGTRGGSFTRLGWRRSRLKGSGEQASDDRWSAASTSSLGEHAQRSQQVRDRR